MMEGHSLDDNCNLFPELEQTHSFINGHNLSPNTTPTPQQLSSPVSLSHSHSAVTHHQLVSIGQQDLVPQEEPVSPSNQHQHQHPHHHIHHHQSQQVNGGSNEGKLYHLGHHHDQQEQGPHVSVNVCLMAGGGNKGGNNGNGGGGFHTIQVRVRSKSFTKFFGTF